MKNFKRPSKESKQQQHPKLQINFDNQVETGALGCLGKSY